MCTRPSQGWKKSARNYCDMFFWHNFVWRNRIHCPFNVLNWLRCPKNRLKIWPKIQRIFKIYKGEIISDTYFNFFTFIKFSSQNRMNVCDCWGPDGRLDTKIDQFDLCHISMSYASYVKIWHIMSYDAYDIEIWHKSIWSILVSKRLSGPQQSLLFIRFWQTNLIKLKQLK